MQCLNLWHRVDLNHRPSAYETPALTPELRCHYHGALYCRAGLAAGGLTLSGDINIIAQIGQAIQYLFDLRRGIWVSYFNKSNFFLTASVVSFGESRIFHKALRFLSFSEPGMKSLTYPPLPYFSCR